jgi:hypothetical protein
LKAYQAYLAYRDLGPWARSIRRVAESLRKSRTLLERWSARYAWVERAHRFHARIERRRETARERELREASQREAAEADARIQARIACHTGIVASLLNSVNRFELLETMPLSKLWSLQLAASAALIEKQKACWEVVLGVSEVWIRDAMQPRAATVDSGMDCDGCGWHNAGFQRWPCEGAKAYAAFRLYAQQEKRHSLREVSGRVSRHTSQIERWSRRYRWAARIALRDARQRQQTQRRLRSAQLETYEAVQALSKSFETLMLNLSTAVRQRRKEFEALDLVTLLKMSCQAARLLPAIHGCERDSRLVVLAGSGIEMPIPPQTVGSRRARTAAQTLGDSDQRLCRQARANRGSEDVNALRQLLDRFAGE